MSDNSDQNNETYSSIRTIPQSEVKCLENTVVITDDFTLVDVLEKFKDQVRVLAAKVNQLNQYLNLINNPTDPTAYQEVLKVKRNIINGITHLLKETKPLNYPSFQSLSSAKLLITYKKVSEQFQLLLNNIKEENENIIKRSDEINNLSICIKDFQQEVNNLLNHNTINTEVEQEVSREFKECKSDLYTLLSLVDPSSTVKEILSLLVELNDDDDEDSWVNMENFPHLITHCHKLKKNGFVLQNEKNKYLFKLNF